MAVLKKWLVYALIAGLGFLALKENGEAQRRKDQAVRYEECMKAHKDAPEECAKLAPIAPPAKPRT